MKILKSNEWKPLEKECSMCQSLLLVEEADISPLLHLDTNQEDSKKTISEYLNEPFKHGFTCPVCGEIIEVPQNELPWRMRGGIFSRIQRRQV